MLVAVTIIHIIITLSLIGLVLLQDPKGGAMGIMGGGGGGSQGVFGATGAGNFLVSATKWVAFAFGITCITLTYFTSHRERSVTDDLLPAAAPITAPATPGTGTVPGAAAGTTPEAQSPSAPAPKPAEPAKINLNATKNATAPGAGPGAGAAAPDKKPDNK